MKIFIVTRPYCSPEQVAIISSTKRKALEVVRDTYGYCASAKAVEKKEEGIILTKNRNHDNIIMYFIRSFYSYLYFLYINCISCSLFKLF